MNYQALFLILYIQFLSKSYGYYFWKDYQNRIPRLAYLAGRDSNLENIYIGQGFLNLNTMQGIYPTSIQMGKDIYVPKYGAQKADRFVQILCVTDPQYFEWIETNSSHFHLIQTNNEIVRGGTESRLTEYYELTSIGRLRIQGEVVIGKIMSEAIGQADMWFVHNGNETRAFSFEVLTYNINKTAATSL